MLIHCPVCRAPLSSETLTDERDHDEHAQSPYRESAPEAPALLAAAIRVARCPICVGLWFDRGQLTEAIRGRLALDPAMLAVARARSAALAAGPTPAPRTELPPASLCPRCLDVKLSPMQSRAAPWVVYQRCDRCHGLWLGRRDLQAFADRHVALLALMLDEFD